MANRSEVEQIRDLVNKFEIVRIFFFLQRQPTITMQNQQKTCRTQTPQKARDSKFIFWLFLHSRFTVKLREHISRMRTSKSAENAFRGGNNYK